MMRLFTKCKDGGPESTVTAYVLFEIKRFASVLLLRFDGDSREAYHDHAFNALSWLLRGKLVETTLGIDAGITYYTPSASPIVTLRDRFHRVDSIGRSWVLSFRGPWSKTWHEIDLRRNTYTTLTNGRKVVS
jgi:hypothetical protein